MAVTDENLHRGEAEVGEAAIGHNLEHGATTPSSNIISEKVAEVPEEELHYAENEPGGKGILKDKKKIAALEDGPVEDAAPPPYTSGPAARVEKPFWKKRWFLLASIGLLALLIILLAVLLGVLLSRKHSGSASSNTSSSPNSSSPTSLSPPSPLSTTHSGDASPPIINTALSAITIPDRSSSSDTTLETSLVQVFFQDSNLYLCSKTSTSGVESWPLLNSGTRILPALNGTPITAVHQPDFLLPIRIFFINPDGYLADIYQLTWGGPWVNGSLSDRQFKVGEQFYGAGYNSISAGWCSGRGTVVYAMGEDLRLYGFQISGEDRDWNGGTWNIVWQSDGMKDGVSIAVNLAAVCLLSADGPPPLFVNSFGGIGYTGQLVTWFNNTNVTVPLPTGVAALYRPNSPIAAIYGRFPEATDNTSGYNNTMLLFFPLPSSISSISPNPSLHILSAQPYWSANAPFGNSVIATEQSLNWTDTQLVDTGVVPYAKGAAALFDDSLTEGADRGGDNLSVDNNVAETMPRAWVPMLMDGKDEGRVVVVYQDDQLAIRIADVVNGEGSYQVINVSN